MYEVLYRKYRPADFNEVVGQEDVISILENALRLNEVAHAFLLSGPRGTGKTTVARILAKRLGISGLDLVEIDAASNRGIDRIRELKDAVLFHPTSGERKMYILDEAHMLTNEAFNALLKTIEEPPAFVYFVLCTTDPQRIPLTVSSRTLKLTFRPPTREVMETFVRSIIAKEGREIEGGVVSQIAKLARGSYRDAMVLIESTIRMADDQSVSPVGVLERLSGASAETVSVLCSMLVQQSLREFYNEYNEVVSGGAHEVHLLDSMIEHMVSDFVLAEEYSNSSESRKVRPVDIVDMLVRVRSRYAQYDNVKVLLAIEITKLFNPNQNPKISKNNQSAKSDDTVNHTDKVEVERAEDILKVDETLDNIGKNLDPQNNDPNIIISDSSSLENLSFSWDEVVSEVRKRKINVEALLKGGKFDRITDNKEIILRFNYAFHKKKMEEIENKRVVEEVLFDKTGNKYVIKCVIDENANPKSDIWDISSAPPPIASQETVAANYSSSGGVKSKKYVRKSMQEDLAPGDKDLLKIAQEIFGGQLIE